MRPPLHTDPTPPLAKSGTPPTLIPGTPPCWEQQILEHDWRVGLRCDEGAVERRRGRSGQAGKALVRSRVRVDRGDPFSIVARGLVCELLVGALRSHAVAQLGARRADQKVGVAELAHAIGGFE